MFEKKSYFGYSKKLLWIFETTNTASQTVCCLTDSKKRQNPRFSRFRKVDKGKGKKGKKVKGKCHSRHYIVYQTVKKDKLVDFPVFGKKTS